MRACLRENLPPQGSQLDATVRPEALCLCQMMGTTMTRNGFCHTESVRVACAEDNRHRASDLWCIQTPKRDHA
jgi:hypothetical protein